ncbi:MAG: hypothetical protein M0T72_08460 [Candidatus Dormibacteraeota bacterium]|nr:hypothetical protein [Candidatus Dormibacteraeota bacterium]
MAQFTSPPTPINRLAPLVATEFNGLAPPVAGALPSAAAADHAHAMNASGRTVAGFGAALSVSQQSSGGGDAGWIISAPVPTLSKWTIEFWVSTGNVQYPFSAGFIGAFTDGGGPPFQGGPGGPSVPSSLTGFAPSFQGAGGAGPGLWANGVAGALGHVAVTGNTWTHFAISCDGITMRLFVGGVLSASQAAPGPQSGNCGITAVNNADNLVGTWPVAIDEFRISSVARYTQNFTPALVPFTTDADTLVLWHFDELPLGAFADLTVDVPTGTSWVQYLNQVIDSSGNGNNGEFLTGGYFVGGLGGASGTFIFSGEISGITATSKITSELWVTSLQGQRGDVELVTPAGLSAVSSITPGGGTGPTQLVISAGGGGAGDPSLYIIPPVT